MNETLTIILGIAFIFLMTSLGALCVFFVNTTSKVLNIIVIGMASGIILSASIFSLILPALEYGEGFMKILPVVAGIILGGLFMVLITFLTRKIENRGNLSKPIRLFSAVTVHNIPEGLAVGFAFGMALISSSTSALSSAMFVAIGIGLQNFPEGLAVSLPIYAQTKSKKKGFLFGFLSGVVEPIFAILGLFLATSISSLMPWLLSFSAGAMIFVVIEELLPELQEFKKGTLGTWSFLIGFLLMMILDVML